MKTTPLKERSNRLILWLGETKPGEHKAEDLRMFLFLADVLFDICEFDITGYTYTIKYGKLHILPSNTHFVMSLGTDGLLVRVPKSWDVVELVNKKGNYFPFLPNFELSRALELIENDFSFEKIAPWGIGAYGAISPQNFKKYRKEFEESIRLYEVMCV